MSLLAMMIGQPMMITQAALDVMLAIAAREAITPEMLEQYPGKPASDDWMSEMIVRGDVGIIPISGPIFRHATLFTRISGGTTTQQIAKDIGTAREDREIKSVVLAINSPGGEAASIGELAGMIRELDGEKPVTAYGDYMAASAAYYLMAAAGRRIVYPASFVGSIGTIAAWTSTKKAKEALGLQDMRVVSPQTPKKGLDPESEEGLAELQDHLRYFSDHFINDVAKFTGKSRKRVMEDFGQGALVNAEEALKVGMIDGFGTLEGVIKGVSGGRKYKVTAPALGAQGGSPVMAKRTWGEFFLGSRANEPVPEEVHDDRPAQESRGGRAGGDDDEKERLRAELREEQRLRKQAESKAEVDSEDRRIQDKVAGWVRSGRVAAAQAEASLKHCRDLSAADRSLNFSGPDSLLSRHQAIIDARKATGVCEEQAPGNLDPGRGGIIVRPPTGPAATTDHAAEDEMDRQSVVDSPYAKVRKNGTN